MSLFRLLKKKTIRCRFMPFLSYFYSRTCITQHPDSFECPSCASIATTSRLNASGPQITIWTGSSSSSSNDNAAISALLVSTFQAL